MSKKQGNSMIITAIWSFMVVLMWVLTMFIQENWVTILKKLTNIEETTTDTYIETIKTNAKVQDVEVIKEKVIKEPIIQPVIIQKIEWPADTFVDRTAINRCIDLFKRACILDWNETPEDCIIDAQYECEADPNTRF